MLRAIIMNMGHSWGDCEDVEAVLEWDSDVLTNQIWKILQLAVRSSYRYGEILKWDLVRVESGDDPWHIQRGEQKMIYGEHLAFGLVDVLFPDRICMNAWRWVGLTCQKIMERSFDNVD